MMRFSHCPSRILLDHYLTEGTSLYDVVIVVDALRATATITRALASGANRVIPVASLEEALAHIGEANVIVAAERGGKRIGAAQLGNDPATYTPEVVAGKDIYLTTTNGTATIKGIEAYSQAEILIGAFTNIGALTELIVRDYAEASLLFVGAGWMGQASLEDSLFAGYLADSLMKENVPLQLDDAAYLAILAAREIGDDPIEAISKGEHFRRLRAFLSYEVIAACLKRDVDTLIPRYDRLSQSLIPLL